ncbi:MAG: hypothetical protein QOD76_2128, partial [Solirubrobacteraceae bacterium]|nr:hypothetical protein [Solirubrobacteraceae bacterium]
EVRVRGLSAQTVVGRRRLETVVGVRAGLSSHRIVVLAHRDALVAPSTADLSGTATLLELGRVYQSRQLKKTLVLVSTSGGSGGAAGAAQFAGDPGGPVDAVLVLGDVAGTRLRKPHIVPWSQRPAIAPIELRRTVASALGQETGLRMPEPRLASQYARLAFPLTTGEQGRVGARGLPAVLISVSGERGPGAERSVSVNNLSHFGRGIVRTIDAIDGRAAATPAPSPALLLRGKLVPQWAIRLLVAALIFPALLAAIDGFARVRRNKHPVTMWLAWTLTAAFPFAFALLVAYLLELVGLLPSIPPAPVRAGAIPLDGGAIAALGSLALVLVVSWAGLRPLVLRTSRISGDPSSPGAAAAVMLVASAVVVATWVANPFAAALLVPALHVGLFVMVPEVRMRATIAFGLMALALVPIGLVALYYAQQLGLSLGEIPWTALLLVAGGHIGVLGALGWCVLLGCLVCALTIAVARARQAPAVEEPTTRGPVSYAGPGSLGGTESALRR